MLWSIHETKIKLKVEACQLEKGSCQYLDLYAWIIIPNNSNLRSLLTLE